MRRLCAHGLDTATRGKKNHPRLGAGAKTARIPHSLRAKPKKRRARLYEYEATAAKREHVRRGKEKNHVRKRGGGRVRVTIGDGMGLKKAGTWVYWIVSFLLAGERTARPTGLRPRSPERVYPRLRVKFGSLGV